MGLNIVCSYDMDENAAMRRSSTFPSATESEVTLACISSIGLNLKHMKMPTTNTLTAARIAKRCSRYLSAHTLTLRA